MIGTILLVALLVLGGANFYNGRAILMAETEDQLLLASITAGEKLASWFDARVAEVAVIGSTSIVREGQRDAVVKYLAEEVKRSNLYLRLFVVDDKGNSLYSNGATSNLADREYFKQVMSSGKPVIADPVISKVDNKAVIVVAAPIKKEGRTTGMIGGTVTIDALNDMIKQVKLGKTGYAYVTQSDGLVMIHPSQDIAMKANFLKDQNVSPDLVSATERMLKGETGTAKYHYQGSDKYLAYAPIRDTSWGLSVNVPVEEVTGKLSTFMITSLITILIALILALAAIILFARKMAAPLKEVSAAVGYVAAGDLSQHEVTVNTQDEVGQLAQAFNTMKGNLRSLVKQVSQAAEQIAASSEEFTASANDSAQAANQMAAAITSVAQAADAQSTSVNETAKVIEQMSAGVNGIASDTRDVSGKANKAADAARSGIQVVRQAVDQMDSIENSVGQSAKVVVQLGERSGEIGQIIDTIANIANQTNLLALNAAIEAARAGEHGRGFAVVAEEVRKLAEQSEEATKQIGVLIGEIQADTKLAVAAMEEGSREVNDGSELVKSAGKVFGEIVALVEEVSQQVGSISEATHQVADGSQAIVTSIRAMEDHTKTVAGEAETVSATTEEQSAAIEEIAASSQSLAKMAAELNEIVRTFKV
jgi:methyl-accepting chemotaxis protein